MAGGKIEVQIGADVTDFKKKVQEVEFDIKELSKVKLDRLKIGLDTTEINAQIKDAKNSLSTLRDSVGKTGNAIGSQFAPKVANGGNALMQFSRIAQDAPFGIMGIGNNITATAEAFGYLKQQTGSTGGALKALASSLMGTGGILLGVSLLTTGLTLLSQSGLSVGDIIDKITGKFDAFGASVKKATEEGLKSAGKEVESLRELVAIAQNDNIAKKDRLVAVENLKTQFPAYYGNLSAEKIMYGDLTKVTNEATKALIAKSVAEKLGDKAGDKFIERLNAQQKFNDSKKELDKFDEDIIKKRQSVANKQEGVFGLTEDIIRKQVGARINLVNKIEEERQSVIKLVKEYDKFGQIIDKLNQTSAPLNQTAPKKIKAKKVNKNAGNEFNPFLNDFSSRLAPEMALTFKDPTQGFLEWNNKINLGLTTTEQYWSTTVENIGNLMENAIQGGIFNIGDSIGDALINGDNVLQAAGGSLLQTLGGFISSIAQEMIKFGVLTAAFGTAKEALQKAGISGGVAIAAGAALAVIGSAISASGKRVSSAAGGSTGGGSQTSTSSGRGANNQSFSSGGFSSSSSNGGTVVFEIAGQKLIGVLNNTINGNKRLGGSLGLG